MENHRQQKVASGTQIFGDFVSFPLCLPKLLLCHAAVVGGRLQGHVHFAAEGLESPKANSFAVLLWFSTSL